jgi:hypothetical protein
MGSDENSTYDVTNSEKLPLDSTSILNNADSSSLSFNGQKTFNIISGENSNFS